MLALSGHDRTRLWRRLPLLRWIGSGLGSGSESGLALALGSGLGLGSGSGLGPDEAVASPSVASVASEGAKAVDSTYTPESVR